MPNRETLFTDDAKVQQFIVQFACRIPARKDIDVGEKKALGNALRDLDKETFQLFDEPSAKNPGCLFQVLHQIPVRASTVTMSSFQLSIDSLSFFVPVKVMGQLVRPFDSFDTRHLNKTMSNRLFSLNDIISNLNFQRAGKIYELVVGPFNNLDKKKIFKDLFSVSLDDVGELNVTFARYFQVGQDLCNIQTNLRYIQQTISDVFFVNVRVDINNRILANRMEPQDVQKVWDFADSNIKEHLNSALEI